MNAVRSVLAEVGAQQVPTLEVFNKVDRLDDGEREALIRSHPEALVVSARDGVGVDALLETIVDRLAMDMARVTLTFDRASEQDCQRLGDL